MSPEPKKPIEELLEATAKARREQFGDDPKMPNPMRAQLHHEITRVALGDESRRSGNWFQILWPRIAFTTVFALILVSISTLWWWHEHPTTSRPAMKLAMQQPAGEASPPDNVFEQDAAAEAVPASTAPALSFADSKAAAPGPTEAPKDVDSLRGLAETNVAPSNAPTTDTFSASGSNKADQQLQGDKSLVAKEARPAAPAAASLAQARQTTNFRQQYSQNSMNQSFRSKLKQTGNILSEFQVEQSDHEIRFVDADGSTYSGKLEPLAENDARSTYNHKRDYEAISPGAVPSLDEKAQSTNKYHFHATGYNTSLKKSLEIEGNYIAPVKFAQKKVARTKAESEPRDEKSSARITGVAKIHGESPVQIDAVAVP